MYYAFHPPYGTETITKILRTRAITVNGTVYLDLLPDTRWIIIRNVSNNPVYLGNETVLDTNGFVLKTDEFIGLNVMPTINIYIFASSPTEIRVIEFA